MRFEAHYPGENEPYDGHPVSYCYGGFRTGGLGGLLRVEGPAYFILGFTRMRPKADTVLESIIANYKDFVIKGCFVV